MAICGLPVTFTHSSTVSNITPRASLNLGIFGHEVGLLGLIQVKKIMTHP